ncbi:ABC transporter permease [Roseococcus sp. SYP-B2431]|uniref:ABC transporter permease n=1 Tax=Roseococcus sp. SYP-B2431 TaxID=2496640 RepID=UPI00103F3842|nr:ABC transporter permease [Roseococcus sp. SYP-B2431]TCH99009.1 ABC transporter permease [Roseococcus sp. SYP-B2431]
MPSDMFSAETRDGRLHLRFSGPLDRAAAAARWDEAHRAARDARAVTLDAGEVTALDSGGAALLVSLAGDEAEWVEPRDPAAQGTLDRFRKGLGTARPSGPRHLRFRPVTALGAYTLGRYHKFLERAAFMGDTILTTIGLLPRPWRLRWAEVLRHLDEAGTQAFPLCILLGTLIGVILAFQSSVPMRQFGATIFIPQLVGISLTRELGPLLAGVILAGRTGSAYAAELGTMRVNEEVDALKTMGLDPTAWLVVPRILASTLVMPALSMVMNITGLIGMSIVMATLGFPPVAVLNQLEQWMSVGDLAGGLAKSAAFGLAIGYVGCRAGLSAGRGPRAVGDAATGAVVGGIVALVLLDGLFAILFFRLGW